MEKFTELAEKVEANQIQDTFMYTQFSTTLLKARSFVEKLKQLGKDVDTEKQNSLSLKQQNM